MIAVRAGQLMVEDHIGLQISNDALLPPVGRILAIENDGFTIMISLYDTNGGLSYMAKFDEDWVYVEATPVQKLAAEAKQVFQTLTRSHRQTRVVIEQYVEGEGWEEFDVLLSQPWPVPDKYRTDNAKDQNHEDDHS